MKKRFLLMLAVLLISGCTTFGSFSNLKQGESAPEDVRLLLGEPDEVLYEDDSEIWTYHLHRENAARPNSQGMRTTVHLKIVLKGNVVDNYRITVSKAQTKPANKIGPGQPVNNSPAQGRGDGLEFIRTFDKNRDGRVSRQEFPGRDRVFHNLDLNADGYIDGEEAPGKAPPKGKRNKP